MKALQVLTVFLLVPALLTGAACNTTKPEVDEVPRSLRGSWVLAELEGVDVPALKKAGHKLPEVLIASDGAVSGFGGVNRFGSTLDLEVLGVEHFVLSPIATNLMAGDPDSMEIERTFLQALQDARQYRIKEGRLELQLEEEQDDEMVVLVLVVLERRS